MHLRRNRIRAPKNRTQNISSDPRKVVLILSAELVSRKLRRDVVGAAILWPMPIV